MKLLAVVFVMLGVAAWAGVWWLANAGGGALPSGPWELFLDSRFLTKLADLLLILLALVVLVAGLIRRSDGTPVLAPLLRILMWTALALGALAALQAGLWDWTVARRLHINHFAVVAPSLGAALIPLWLAFFVAAACAGLAPRRRPVAAG